VVLNLARVVNWKWYYNQAIVRAMDSIPNPQAMGYISWLWVFFRVAPWLKNFLKLT
jgi:hypothetical protein